MLEYLNIPGFVIIFLLGLFVYLLEKFTYTKGFSFLNFLTLILFGMLFLEAYTTKNTVENNKRDFMSDKQLKCHSGGGLYSSGQTYRVSKESGWEVQDNYFLKGDLMIRIENCK